MEVRNRLHTPFREGQVVMLRSPLGSVLERRKQSSDLHRAGGRDKKRNQPTQQPIINSSPSIFPGRRRQDDQKASNEHWLVLKVFARDVNLRLNPANCSEWTASTSNYQTPFIPRPGTLLSHPAFICTHTFWPRAINSPCVPTQSQKEKKKKHRCSRSASPPHSSDAKHAFHPKEDRQRDRQANKAFHNPSDSAQPHAAEVTEAGEAIARAQAEGREACCSAARRRCATPRSGPT